MTFTRVAPTPSVITAYLFQNAPDDAQVLRVATPGPYVDLPKDDAVAFARYILDKFHVDSKEAPNEETSS